jgi:TolB-like protein/DNA-binding SARP family transcriptional activator/Flp pilus assembly protein TadD
MFTLQLFGGAALHDERGPLGGPAAQRRRLALLALLATAPGGRVGRERIAAYLWPEADAEAARSRLVDAVHGLRKALGREALLSVGDELHLNARVVRSDVVEFRSALAAGALEQGIALYAGPFLDGFFVTDASEFERWTESERERLAAEYVRAVEALAEQRETAQDFRGAAEHWSRRAAHDPYNSRVALRLMRALDAAGDRAGALQQARIHTLRLREDLELDVEPEIAAEVQRLREGARTPQRLPPPGGEPTRAPLATPPLARQPRGDVAVVDAPALSLPATRSGGAADAAAARAPRSRPPGRLLVAPAVLVLLVLIVVAGDDRWARRTAGAAEATRAIRSLAVLPLANLSGDPEQEYFADGMTDALITELARYGELRVISRMSAMQYRRSGKPLPQIARELGVDALVMGTVLQEGGRVRITAQLIHTAGGEHLWADSYERDLRSVLALQREVAQSISHAVRARAANGRLGGGLAANPVNPRAFAHYLRALHLWNEDAMERYTESIRHFEHALELEPEFALAYAGLGEIYVHLDEWIGHPRHGARAKAFSNLRRALELDESLAEARTSLAHLLMHEEEWAAAEREYLRAIELNPSYAYARLLYAFQLVALERMDEAVHQARLALELDPLSWRTNQFVASTLYFARRYEEAIALWQHMLELHPAEQAATRFHIAECYLALGQHARAVEQAEQAARLSQSASSLLRLAAVYAGVGRRDDARRIMQQSLPNDAAAALSAGVIDGLALAQLFSRLGDRDRALHWLEQAIEQELGWTMFLRVEPAYDPLRGDPRFAKLLRRMKLE